MIISQTPLRVSFLGGGNDYPGVFKKWGGMVVGSTITQSVFVSVRRLPPFHPYKTRLVYSRIEQVSSLDDIQHNLIRACLQKVGEEAVEVFHQADMPGRSGTGSSSSFVVGLLNALYALRGVYRSPLELAQEAIEVERVIVGEQGGVQDQLWGAFGGLNAIRIYKDGEFTVSPLNLPLDRERELESHLLLFYMNGRTSSEVASGYAQSLPERQRDVHAMARLAERGLQAILDGQWAEFGRCVDLSWRVKASLPGVSTTLANKALMTARVMGAYGGKGIGAGGGGCCMLVAPPESHSKIFEHLIPMGLIHVPLKFSHQGSRIIFAERGL